MMIKLGPIRIGTKTLYEGMIDAYVRADITPEQRTDAICDLIEWAGGRVDRNLERERLLDAYRQRR